MSLPTLSPERKNLFPSKNDKHEVLTQDASVNTSVEKKLIRSAEGPIVSGNFLSTDESSSDFDVLENEETCFDNNYNRNNIWTSKSKDFSCDKLKLKNEKTGTKSLENSTLEIKEEVKSGFSIWSLMSQDLRLERNDAQSSSTNKGFKINTFKLRNALRGRHFLRIESKLRKLLNRRKS